MIRKRLPQAESRLRALDAARDVLIELGPQGVTLKAVAARIGRTHANLLHHFGSAGGLQKALTEHLATAICRRIGIAFQASRDGVGTPREVVDLIFEAFAEDGGGALASWLLLSGEEEGLTPIIEEICKAVDRFDDFKRVREVTHLLVLLAFGDARVGGILAKSLDIPRSTAREAAELILKAALERHSIGADFGMNARSVST